MKRIPILLLVLSLGLVACRHTNSEKTQHIEFAGFTVDEGVYKPKPGWKFTAGGKNTIVVARQNTGPGVVITPCACALENGGACMQASIDGPNGDIKEVWCVDDKCGFCVGGTGEPDDEATFVRFSVVCKPRRS